MVLAIYTRSPSAYEALKGFDILWLPSKSLLQLNTGAFLVLAASALLIRLLDMCCLNLNVSSMASILPSLMEC